LIAEGESEPVEGWDFSWLAGRAREERPSWGYTRSLVSRVTTGRAVLDVQTGGGEVFAEILRRAGTAPSVVAATESWTPNLQIARQNLAPFSATVVETADDQALPFGRGHFDLVVSRHPTVVVWSEIARVLQPGGTYFSQQVGSGSNRELTDFMMGPQPVSDRRSPERAVEEAATAGLEVIDLRQEALKVCFYDVGAVTYFLRKVLWTVPGFSVDRYRHRLQAMHDHIHAHGYFRSYAQRFLIEAKKRR
jgi:SAM-dependent methyltransferase